MNTLRLWPGVAACVLLLGARFGLKALIPGFNGFSLSMQSSFGVAALVLVWWLFFSRARWSERLGALAILPPLLFAYAGNNWKERMGRLGIFVVVFGSIFALC